VTLKSSFIKNYLLKQGITIFNAFAITKNTEYLDSSV